MSKQPNFSAELLRLCGQMRDQSITPEEAKRLNSLLAQSKPARQFYLRFMSVTAGLETQLEQSKPADQAAAQSDVDVLLDLLRMEQDAPIVAIDTAESNQPNPQPAAKASTHMDIGLALYIAKQALRSKPAQWLAAAAAIALCVLVAVQFVGPTNTPAPVANQSQAPSSNAPIARKVATLTATHDAVWKQPGGDHRPGALVQGTQLSAGTRLTLTQGLAEITTARGAIAIIQAPATIELTHNDNAIQLHAGKLVGICETPSSKGFVVRTPHMDITDLGTRFGVDATASQTEVHVLEGEVEASQQTKHADEPITKRLVEGDAITASASADRFVSIENNDAAFAAINTFARSIPTAGAKEVGIAALSGDIKWSPFSAYAERRNWPSDNRAVVFEELPRYELAADAPVTLIGPGSTKGIGNKADHAIPAGTTVRTYIVMLYGNTPGEKASATGSVTFDGEVLGIATTSAQASQFTNTVGDPARLAPIRRVNFHWLDEGDRAALAEDRRTVTFQGAASGPTTDAIRVFVRVPGD